MFDGEGSTGFAAVEQILAAGGGNVNPMLREQTIETWGEVLAIGSASNKLLVVWH